MNLAAFVAQETCVWMVESLAQVLWQGVLVAGLAAVAAVALRNRSAQARYFVHCIAMLLTVACLPLNLLLLVPSDRGEGAGVMRGASIHSVEGKHAPGSVDGAPVVVNKTLDSIATTPIGPEVIEEFAQPLKDAAETTLTWEWASQWIVAAYVAGIGVMAIRLLMGLYGSQRLRTTAQPIEEARLHQVLLHLSDKLRLRAIPVVAYSARVATPLVVGVVKPAILLPAAILNELTVEQVEALLLHELAHLRRYDHWVNLLQRVVEAVLFFHPAVWWLSHKISLEREHCCDDLAIRWGSEPCNYAESLVRMSEIRYRSLGLGRSSAATLAATGRRPIQLRGRVLRVLGMPLPGPSVGLTGVGVASLLLTTFTSAMMLAALPTESDMGEVKAVVVDPDGNPVADAEVTIFGVEGEQTARSDTEGRVTLPDDPRELVMIVAQGGDGLSCLLRVPSPSEPTTSERTESDELRIRLAPSRRLEVEVKTAEGDPVADASVLALGGWAETVRVVTDDAGKAELFLPTEMSLRQVLVTSAEGVDYALFRRPDAPASDPYRLPPDFDGTVALKLTPTRTVEVRVVDASGAPIEGATINPWLLHLPNHGDAAHLERLWKTTTGVDGVAELTTIPAKLERPITLWIHKEGYKELRFEYDPSKDKATLTASLPSLVEVRGRVTGPDDKPPSGITVVATGTGYELDGFNGYVQPSDIGADGTFTIDVNPNQFYAFTAMAEGWATPLVTRVVLSESPDAIELRLEPATKVTGTVVDSVTGEPVAGHYVSLYRHVGNVYHELPEEDRLPNPTDSRRYISAYATLGTQTDSSGRFEFSTGPGQHYFITERSVAESRRFDLASGAEAYSTTLKVKPLVTGTLKGRVVLADDPETPVAEARIEDNYNLITSAVSDADGAFELPLSDAPRTMGAFTADRKFGAVIQVEPSAATAEFRLAPTASLVGKLGNTEGDVCAGDEVVVSVRVDNPDGTFSSRFQRHATTDEEGEFTVEGIALGVEYQVTVVTDRDGKGSARGWSNVTTFRADKPGRHDLGAVSYRVHREPKIEDYLSRIFADEPAERLDQRLADAKLAYQQVLLVVGTQQSDAVRCLVGAKNHIGQWNAENDLRHAMADYVLVGVEPTDEDLLDELSVVPPSDADGFTLAVIDPDRRVVASVDATDVSKNNRLSAARVTEFLKTRRAPLPDAEEAYAAALAEAKRDDKRVFVVVSGAGCAPCVVLSRFLDKHADVFSKDYAVVKLDARMPHGGEVIDRVRGDDGGGVPWMAILDSEGKRIADSAGPEGKVGYPSTDSDKAHFRKMIETTRVHLDQEQVEAILSAL